MIMIPLLLLAMTLYQPYSLSKINREYEQRLDQELGILKKLTTELSSIRTDKISSQGVEQERKKQEQLQQQATQQAKTLSGRSSKNIFSSIGGGYSQRRPSGYSTSGYSSRSAYSPRSSYGGRSSLGNMSQSGGYTRMGQGPQRSSTIAQKSSSSSPVIKKSSEGYTASKNEDKKTADERITRINQFKATATTLTQELKTITDTIARVRNNGNPEQKHQQLLNAYAELNNQSIFSSASTTLSTYSKQVTSLTTDDKKKVDGEISKISGSLSRALPMLAQFILTQHEPLKSSQQSMVNALKIHVPSILGKEDSVKNSFVKAEATVVNTIEAQLRSLESLSRRPTIDAAEYKNIKLKLAHVNDQLQHLSIMPLGWSKQTARIAQLKSKITHFTFPVIPPPPAPAPAPTTLHPAP